jgi:nicotinate phosphoribosyltransferase
MSESVLLTDLYQLTMLQGYFVQGMRKTAVFEFFVRKLPERRNFLIAAGLEQALDYLEQVAFTEEELAWLATQGRLGADFLLQGPRQIIRGQDGFGLHGTTQLHQCSRINFGRG